MIYIRASIENFSHAAINCGNANHTKIEYACVLVKVATEIGD